MPCDGPSDKYAYLVGEEATKDVMELLRNKYHLSDKPFGLKDQWHEAEANLKKAIQEMIFADHCSSF
jgi:hypothetical protein